MAEQSFFYETCFWALAQDGDDDDVQLVRSGWYDPAWTDSQPDQGEHAWWLDDTPSPTSTALDTPVPNDKVGDKTDAATPSAKPMKISKSPSVEEIMSEIQELKRTVEVLQLENTTLKSVVQSKEVEIECLKKNNAESDKPKEPQVAGDTEGKEVPIPSQAPAATSEDTGEGNEDKNKGAKPLEVPPEDTPEDKAQQHVNWAPITKQGLEDFLRLCRGYTSIVVPPVVTIPKLPVAITQLSVSKDKIIEWHPLRKEAMDDFMGTFRREAPQDMTLEELIEYANGTTSKNAFDGVPDEVMATIQYIWYLKETWDLTDPIDVEYWLAGESGPKFFCWNFLYTNFTIPLMPLGLGSHYFPSPIDLFAFDLGATTCQIASSKRTKTLMTRTWTRARTKRARMRDQWSDQLLCSIFHITY